MDVSNMCSKTMIRNGMFSNSDYMYSKTLVLNGYFQYLYTYVHIYVRMSIGQVARSTVTHNPQQTHFVNKHYMFLGNKDCPASVPFPEILLAFRICVLHIYNTFVYISIYTYIYSDLYIYI